jgi:hypothetical protein
MPSACPPAVMIMVIRVMVIIITTTMLPCNAYPGVPGDHYG